MTWNSFDAVRAAYEAGGFDGVGFVLRGDLGLVGVDVDHQRWENGGWSEEARSTTSSFASYTEISPSGNGLRVLARGTAPRGRQKCGNFEMYGAKRYLTLTGHRLDGAPASIEPNQSAINDFHKRFLAPHPKTAVKTGHLPVARSTARHALNDEDLL